MCFSATASFMAAAPLSVVGGATLKKVKKKSQIPFALIPLLFALQQVLEGIVWLTFGTGAFWQMIHTISVYAYSIYAHAFWPIFLPFAIRLLETNPVRKNVLLFLQLMGLSVGLYLLYFMLTYHVTASVVEETIKYQFYNPFSEIVIFLYLTAGCLSFFVSSNKIINLLGVLLTISLAITYYAYSTYVVSIWCFFSAILSFVVFFYFTKQKGRAKSK